MARIRAQIFKNFLYKRTVSIWRGILIKSLLSTKKEYAATPDLRPVSLPCSSTESNLEKGTRCFVSLRLLKYLTFVLYHKKRYKASNMYYYETRAIVLDKSGLSKNIKLNSLQAKVTKGYLKRCLIVFYGQ